MRLPVRGSAPYLLQRLLAVQTRGGHLGQQDGHVLLLLPQPDETLTHVSVHHTERHFFLAAQSLMQVSEVGPDTGACTLCCARDLRGAGEATFRQKMPS